MESSTLKNNRIQLQRAVRTAILFRLEGDTYQDKIDNNKVLSSWTAADLSRYVSGKLPSTERLLELDAATGGYLLNPRINPVKKFDHIQDEMNAKVRDNRARLITMHFGEGINTFLEVFFNILIKRFDGPVYEKDSREYYPHVRNRANSLSFNYVPYESRKQTYHLVIVRMQMMDEGVRAKLHLVVRNNHFSDKFHSIPFLVPGATDTFYFPYEKERLHRNERMGQPYFIVDPDGTTPLTVVRLVDLVEQVYAIQKKSLEDFYRPY